MNHETFITASSRNIHQISRRTFALVLAMAISFEIIDVVYWSVDWNDWRFTVWLLIPFLFVSMAVEYLGITDILGERRSLAAFVWFACTSTLLFIPSAAAIGVAFAATSVGKPIALGVFFLGTLATTLGLIFLPAWPVAQALSTAVVGPARVLRATHGFRWGLFSIFIIIGVINGQHFIPAVKDAHDFAQAFVYAAAAAVLTSLSTLFTASAAATAYLFACENDNGLRSIRDI